MEWTEWNGKELNEMERNGMKYGTEWDCQSVDLYVCNILSLAKVLS